MGCRARTHLENIFLPMRTFLGQGEHFSKADFEKERILEALRLTNFNKSKAAQLLQITRKTLYNKINQYQLDV